MRTNPGANINTDWQINGIVKPAHVNAITRSIQYDYVVTPQMLEGKTGTVNVDTLLGGGVINGVTGTYRVLINANVPAAVTLYFPANSIGPSGTLKIHVYSIGPFAALLDESPANGVAYYFHSHGQDTAVTLKSMIPNMHVGSFIMEEPIAMASGYSFTYETALEEMPYIPEGVSAAIVRQAWMSNGDGAPAIVYFDIESIDNPPPGLHLTIQAAATDGKIPVIRYNGALYYFDKEFLYNDIPAYSFVGRLDSDEWETAIRVTGEGVTLGNVLGVDGSVANDVHNSFPLGGRCGIDNNDEDYPNLVFDNRVYPSFTTFNGDYCYAYVSEAGESVSVKYGSETTVIQTEYSSLMFVIYKMFVSESYNASGITLPPGFIVIEKPYGHTILAERAPVDRIVEAQNYDVILIKNTFSLSPGMKYDNAYTVHGGFWKKSTSSAGCKNALSVGEHSIAGGSSCSIAFNGGNAAGPVSVANGAGALAGGAMSASLGQYSMAAFEHSIAFGEKSDALHRGAMVLAAYGKSGQEHQTVLGRNNVMDPDAAVVIGWGGAFDDGNRKNITRIDTDGNIFTGKRLDLANDIMPLFKLPDSDPASPGTEPVTGYWICDSQKNLVTAAEIVALHAMGMKFVLCESTDPAMNSRLYVEQKCNITGSTIDIEFVSAADTMITKIVVQKETTAQVTDASLYIASSTVSYIERQWKRQPETVTSGLDTYAAVTNGQLTFGSSRMLARVRLLDSNMGGGATFTINVQKNLYNEVEDNMVYVVNGTTSTVTVAVKCNNAAHLSNGTVTINAGYCAYVKVNPLYFEVVDAGIAAG